MRKHHGLVAVIASGTLALAGCGAGVVAADRATPAKPHHAAATDRAHHQKVDPVEFRGDVRALWLDHVAWTRLFIVSAVAGLPDTDATAARLLRNQADIGNAFGQFYGNDAGEQLEALLRDHILIAADLVGAAKAGNDAAVTERTTAWYANADAISQFLADANPAWPVATLTDMMHTHLDQTLVEATAQLTGDYATSIAEYDHISAHILEMADTLADGIIQQFPSRFAGAGGHR